MRKLIIILLVSVAIQSCKKTSTPKPPDTSKKYTITASPGAGGSIDPAGVNSVAPGSSWSYNIIPNTNYGILTLTVDGKAILPVRSSYDFSDIEANHTISATFAQDVNITVIVTNGTATSDPVQAISGGSVTLTIAPKPTFHTDSVYINGVFTKLLKGTTMYTVNNITANETIKVTCSDVLTKTQLDSLGNILAGKWHYVQYDYQYKGTTIWNIAPYLTDCEKARYEVYTANHNYTIFLGGASCDPSYSPTNIYFNGTWKFDAPGKSILIAGNEYSNATTYQYVTGAFTVEKLTADSLVISYPVYGQNFSYRYHYAHK